MKKPKKYVSQSWHTYLFDSIFIILNFTFFPLVGWKFIEWFDIWLAGKGKDVRQILIYAGLLGVTATVCRIAAVFLKRFSIRKRFEHFNRGIFLIWLNIAAIFFSYLIAYVGLVEFFFDTRSENFSGLLAMGIFLVLFIGAVIIDFILFGLFDDDVNQTKKSSESKIKEWLAHPFVEFFADLLLFVYILILQCFYYAYMAETLEAGYGIIVMLLIFLFLYAAPRLIYSESYEKDSIHPYMLILVFILSIAGFYLPESIAWLF